MPRVVGRGLQSHAYALVPFEEMFEPAITHYSEQQQSLIQQAIAHFQVMIYPMAIVVQNHTKHEMVHHQQRPKH